MEVDPIPRNIDLVLVLTSGRRQMLMSLLFAKMIGIESSPKWIRK